MMQHDPLSKSIRQLPVKADPPERLSRLKNMLIVGGVIAACMVGVIIISLTMLLDKSIRLDESQSLWQSSHSFRGILRVIAIDVHVPLYHMLLHVWQQFFGQEIATARLMSLSFFLLSIPVIYLTARQLLTRNWALFVVALFSFSPFMNWYANEARMYTLLVFLSSLSVYFFIRIMQGRSWGWPGFIVASMLGVYSHYFFLFTLATLGLFAIVFRKQFPRRIILKLIMVGILLIAELAPWLIYFYSMGAGSTERPLLYRPSSVDFFNAYSQFVFGFQTNRINTILVSCWPLLMLIAFFAVKRGQQFSRELNLMAFLAFVPIGLAFIVSLLVTPFFLSRYMITAVAPLYIILVWLISRYKHRLARVIAVVLVAGFIVSLLQQNLSSATPVNEDYRAVVSDIEAQAQPNDVVALSAPFTIYPFEYYYDGKAPIETLPQWNREATGAIPAFSAEQLPEDVDTLKKDHRLIFLVLSQDQGYETEISTYFRDNFERVSTKTYSPGLTLYVYKVGYYTVPALQDAGQIR